MQIINVVEVMNSTGVQLKDLRPDNVDKASQFFSYHYESDSGISEVVNVESTARILMAEFLCLPIEVQKKVFFYIARMLKHPGDQAVIEGDNRRRGARVVRLASDCAQKHNFLLTH